MSAVAAELASRLDLGLGVPDPGPVLPVADDLAALLPAGGLRRGSVLRVERSAALALALLGRASGQGAWCAVVGMPTLGMLAAADQGVDIRRLALIPRPGREWTAVVAALLGTVDIVLLQAPGDASAADARRVAARTRERGAVLLVVGEWAGADVVLRPTAARWYGLGPGHGRLRGGRLDVVSGGRGAAARPRRGELLLGDVGTVPPPEAPGSKAA